MDKLVKRGIATIVIGLGLIWAVAAGFALLFSVLSSWDQPHAKRPAPGQESGP
jgi:hypothetical protein